MKRGRCGFTKVIAKLHLPTLIHKIDLPLCYRRTYLHLCSMWAESERMCRNLKLIQRHLLEIFKLLEDEKLAEPFVVLRGDRQVTVSSKASGNSKKNLNCTRLKLVHKRKE